MQHKTGEKKINIFHGLFAKEFIGFSESDRILYLYISREHISCKNSAIQYKSYRTLFQCKKVSIIWYFLTLGMKDCNFLNNKCDTTFLSHL